MAAPRRIVIGAGPGGLQAAAALASSGVAVTLLQQGPTPSGLQHPHQPLSGGWMRVRAEAKPSLEAILGPLAPADPPTRSIFANGEILSLPLRPWQVHPLFGRGAQADAARDWLSARMRTATAELTGSGQEERTYQDWVVRRMGIAALETLYVSYARRRWARSVDALSASLARVHHGMPDVGPFVVDGNTAEQRRQRMADVITGQGGQIFTDAQISAIHIDDGVVSGVSSAHGDFPVAEDLWVAASPAVVNQWLGDHADTSMQVDARYLAALPSVIVAAPIEVKAYPDEIHVLDDALPFWCVRFPRNAPGLALFQVTLPEADAPLDVASLTDAILNGAKAMGLSIGDNVMIERIEDHQPIWVQGGHARLRRNLRLWRKMRIVGVGRAGFHADLDLGQHLELLMRYAREDAPDQAELHRLFLDPPVRFSDLDARITRWLTR
ncbi:MAG: NAD(P)-binding protein [Myxococcota bacterium]